MSDSLFIGAGMASVLEVRKLARSLSQQRARDRSSRASQKAELEEALGRVALLARTLADLCISKGLITREELLAQLRHTDFADGALDGRLDADVVLPGESKTADLAPLPVAARRGKQAGKGRSKRRDTKRRSRDER